MAFGGSETGLLYEGPISLVYTLIAAIYCWIFAGVFNVRPFDCKAGYRVVAAR